LWERFAIATSAAADSDCYAEARTQKTQSPASLPGFWVAAGVAGPSYSTSKVT
jgi:hypothetical protein